MTFQQIQYIVEIARCGSISKATKRLFVAQPYLSNVLKDLEKEIGITIFTRDNRGVELTHEGREFIAYVRPLLEQRDKIMEMYSAHQTAPLWRFSVSTQRYPFITKAFVDFLSLKQWDKYEVHIREHGMYRVIDDVYEGHSEIGVIFMSLLTERFIRRVLASKNLEFHEIKEVTPCVFFAAKHPMAPHKTIRLEQMGDYPYALFEQNDELSADFSEEVMLYDFSPPKRRIYVSERGTLFNIIVNTDAYSIGSGILTTGYADGIVSRPIEGHENEMRLGIIKRMGTAYTDDINDFVEHICKILQD